MVVPCIVKTWLYRSALSSLPLGVASWRRISSASQPPTTKNTSAQAPYILAIFLWSTVVTQLRHPVVARGRVKTPSGLRLRLAVRRWATPGGVGVGDCHCWTLRYLRVSR